jgi:integrase
MAHNRLTARTVATVSKRGRHADGGGLYLQVSKWGSKSWVFRYERDGIEKNMGLGSVNTLSLAEARERARKCRHLLLDGMDPIADRKSKRAHQRAQQARAATFEECAVQCHAAQRVGWKNGKYARQWLKSLEDHAFPIIGCLPIEEIDTGLIRKTLDLIWNTKPRLASVLRGRIESVLDWATVSKMRSGENPARWRGHLDKLYAAPTKVRRPQHLAAVAYADLPEFMARLQSQPELAARALEFTILTAARVGEVLGATWDEIKLAKETWEIPAARMKGSAEHRVPLPALAIRLLEELPRTGERLFPGMYEKKMWKVVTAFTPGATIHGFRSSFRDWAAERTNYPNHVVEMALAHAIPSEASPQTDKWYKIPCT